MQPRVVPPPLVEAFLIIEQPRQRLGHWMAVLAALDSNLAPPLAMVTAYYDPTTDEAILGLRYDELALGNERLAYVIEVAMLSEVGMVQPALLSEGERKRFLHDRLARCTLELGNQRNIVSALGELVRLVKEAKAHELNTFLGTMPQRRPASPPPLPPQAAARGTRDDLERASRSAVLGNVKPTRDLEPPAPPRTDLPRPDRSSDAGASLRLPVAEDYDETERPHRRSRSPSQTTTGAYVSQKSSASGSDKTPMTTPATPAVIYARFLRSGRWVPIRVGALSLKGAALLTGALPRLRDNVDIALAFGGHRALVRGAVGKISSDKEASSSGAAMFTVSFDLDDAARRQLTMLLTAARAANITIKPPPPRATRRFPVEWAICLGTTRGAVRAQALDLSQDGMFVRPATALSLGSSASFSTVLDDAGAPISGRAKVVRQISEAGARTAGLNAGFGLQIVDMSEADRLRWISFVGRVEQRADKRVLIGASPARLAELQSLLAASGYAVTGGTDPGALVQLARGENRPVDAALIDSGWLAPNMSPSWVESLFSARDVPCLTLHGDPRGARQAVDRLLVIS